MSHETALFEFHFPDIGEGLTEGTIVELKVAAGSRVALGQPLAVVETDKVVTELPSPVEGTIVDLRIVKGQVVQVGETVARIRTAAAAAAPAHEPPRAAHQDPGSVVGRLDTAHAAVLPPSDEGFAVPRGAAGNGGGGHRMRASPVARRLAAEAGIDLAALEGTGPGGRILKKDLAARSPAAPVTPHGPGARRLSTMRLAIAQAMEKSQAIPAAAVHDYTIVDELLRIRRDMNEALREKVGLLAFFVKAVAHALKEFPLLSSIYAPEKKEYESFPAAHIGVAVDTDDGLVVPVVRDPASLGVVRINAEISRLTEKARSRTLLLEEIRGGTFTISNFGSFAGLYGNPMILPPQVGILGIGRVHQQPEVRDGAVVPASVLPLSLVVDHRLIDGVYACRFLARFMELVSRPLALLTQ
jgi:pyruvate dehydrogenase E2 component (dihydrolipoamide acetyltransferase)